MGCSAEVLRGVSLFSNLDDDELRVLAGQVEHKQFAARQRIYHFGSHADRAYVVVSGAVCVTALDEDHQEVVIQQPRPGDFFGFASMLEQTPHQSEAVATTETACIEIDRNDLMTLFHEKPHSIIDILAFLGRELHNAHQLARARSMRPPEEVIDEQETFGEGVADKVAAFGGSWTFISMFIAFMVIYAVINVLMRGCAGDPILSSCSTSFFPCSPPFRRRSS
jgi:CRP-like cAMP-binding protein